MGKKVLVISTSPRVRSNSEFLASEFARGAAEAGHEVEQVSLRGREIQFCRGCMACQTAKRCVIRDDADLIEQKMEKADVLVFATPIYYYEMSGQMKTLLDRCNPLFPSDYRFRSVYLMSVAADAGDYVPEKAASGLQGWVDCFEKASFAGSLFCGGINDAGEAEKHQKALAEAYEFGKNLK